MNKDSSTDLSTIIGKIEQIEKRLQQTENDAVTSNGTSSLQDITRLFDLIDTLTQNIDSLESDIDDLESRLSFIENLRNKS